MLASIRLGFCAQRNLMQTQNTSVDKGDGAQQPQKQVGSNQATANSNPVIPVPTAAKKCSSVYGIPLAQIIPELVDSKEQVSDILREADDNFGTLQELVANINNKLCSSFKKKAQKACSNEFILALEIVQMMRM